MDGSGSVTRVVSLVSLREFWTHSSTVRRGVLGGPRGIQWVMFCFQDGGRSGRYWTEVQTEECECGHRGDRSEKEFVRPVWGWGPGNVNDKWNRPFKRGLVQNEEVTSWKEFTVEEILRKESVEVFRVDVYGGYEDRGTKKKREVENYNRWTWYRMN